MSPVAACTESCSYLRADIVADLFLRQNRFEYVSQVLIEFAEGIPLLGDLHLCVDWFRSPNRVDRSSALSSSGTI